MVPTQLYRNKKGAKRPRRYTRTGSVFLHVSITLRCVCSSCSSTWRKGPWCVCSNCFFRRLLSKDDASTLLLPCLGWARSYQTWHRVDCHLDQPYSWHCPNPLRASFPQWSSNFRDILCAYTRQALGWEPCESISIKRHSFRNRLARATI